MKFGAYFSWSFLVKIFVTEVFKKKKVWYKTWLPSSLLVSLTPLLSFLFFLKILFFSSGPVGHILRITKFISGVSETYTRCDYNYALIYLDFYPYVHLFVQISTIHLLLMKPLKSTLPSDIGILWYFQMWRIPCLKIQKYHSSLVTSTHLNKNYAENKITMKLSVLIEL